MGTVLETLMAVICVLGLTGAGWWLLGRLLRPLPCGRAFVLLCGRGEGETLEHAVRGFMWLRSLGLLTVPVLIADLGLTAGGRAVALRLCARWPGVVLWPADDLKNYLNEQ